MTKKKRKKKRTQNKVRNATIQGMRKAFAHFSPTYLEVVEKRRITKPRYLKDGITRHKVDEVWYSCSICNKLEKKLEVDHLDPVAPIGKSYKDMTLDEIYERLDCPITNLQGICKECHENKTALEKIKREEAKND